MPAFSHLYARPTSTEIVAVSGSDFLVLDTSRGAITAGTCHFEQIDAQYPLVDKHKAPISVVGFTNDGAKAATFSDDKVLRIWQTTNWQCLFSLDMPKRVNALSFNTTGDILYAADKFGDVYRLNLTEETIKPGQPIVGHVSMITDMALSSDDAYLMTADRDEKVRITQTANTDSVWAFLLGHSRFVSALHIPSFADHIIVSGGGDGYLMVWNYRQAQAIQSISIASIARPHWDKDATTHNYSDNFAVRHILSLPSKKTLVCLEAVRALLILHWSEEQQQYLDNVEVIPCHGAPISATVDTQGNYWVSLNETKPEEATMLCLSEQSNTICVDNTHALDFVTQISSHLAPLDTSIASQLKKQG